MNNFSRVLLIAIVVLFGAATVADAGWVMSEMNGDDLYVSKGKIRAESEGGAFIIDGTSGMIHFFDDARKCIRAARLTRFVRDMEQMMEKMMEGIPEEQREMMMKMVGEENAPEVEIVEKGAGRRSPDLRRPGTKSWPTVKSTKRSGSSTTRSSERLRSRHEDSRPVCILYGVDERDGGRAVA